MNINNKRNNKPQIHETKQNKSNCSAIDNDDNNNL